MINQKEEKKSSLVGIIVVAFLAAVCTYILLIGLEKRALSEYEKDKVWIVNKEIKTNKTVTEENATDLFKEIEMDRKQIPKTAITNLEKLYGKRTVLVLSSGMVVCESMFTGEQDIIADLKKPIIVGWKANDLSLASNGILRAGDRVNIYVYENEDAEATCMWKEVLVYQVFDSVGNEIASEDTEGIAVRINMVLEEEEVERFYAKMKNADILLVLAK